VSCVIAQTFARMFFRNAINIGLPLLGYPDTMGATEAGQALRINLASGRIRNIDTGEEYRARPYPPFMLDIIDASGLVECIRRKLGEKKEHG